MQQERLYLSYPKSAAPLGNRLKRDLEKAGYAVVTRAGLTRYGAAEEIQRATRFLACFTADSDDRAAAELALAVERLKAAPGRLSFISLKLEPCDIASMPIDETISEIDPIDLAVDWEAGIAEIVVHLNPLPPAPISKSILTMNRGHIGGDFIQSDGGAVGHSESTLNDPVIDGNTKHETR